MVPWRGDDNMPAEVMPTLLTVDDEPEIRRLNVNYAEGLGFKVLEAEDGRAALALHSTSPADIIVSDLKMPKMDGMTLLKELRDRGDRTPFLFLSAFTSNEYTLQALSLGAFDYLEKPFLPKEFKSLLNEMLRVSRSLKASFLKAGLPVNAIAVESSPEAEILRISSLHGESSELNLGPTELDEPSRSLKLKRVFAEQVQIQLLHGREVLAGLHQTESPAKQLGYLFRLMHSISSTASKLNLLEIRDLAHAMEQTYVLLRVRSNYLNKVTLVNLNAAHELLRKHFECVAHTGSGLRSEDPTRLQEETQQILLELQSLSGMR